MSVRYQNYSVDLTGGIDTKSERKYVMPGRLLSLVNGTMSKIGSIAKRVGARLLKGGITSHLPAAGDLSRVINKNIGHAKLFTNSRGVLCAARGHGLSVYSGNNQEMFRDHGVLPTAKVTEEFVGNSSRVISSVAGLTVHGFRFLIEKQTGGTIDVYIYSDKDGALVSHEAGIPYTWTGLVPAPLILYDERYVYLVIPSDFVNEKMQVYAIDMASGFPVWPASAHQIDDVYSVPPAVVGDPVPFCCGVSTKIIKKYSDGSTSQNAFIMYQKNDFAVYIMRLRPGAYTEGKIYDTGGLAPSSSAQYIAGSIDYIYHDASPYDATRLVTNVLVKSHNLAGTPTTTITRYNGVTNWIPGLPISSAATAIIGPDITGVSHVNAFSAKLTDKELGSGWMVGAFSFNDTASPNYHNTGFYDFEVLGSVNNDIPRRIRNMCLYSDIFVPEYLKNQNGVTINRFMVALSFNDGGNLHGSGWAKNSVLSFLEMETFSAFEYNVVGRALTDRVALSVSAIVVFGGGVRPANTIDNQIIEIYCMTYEPSSFLLESGAGSGNFVPIFSSVRLKLDFNQRDVFVTKKDLSTIISTGLLLWNVDGANKYEHGFIHPPTLINADLSSGSTVGYSLSNGVYGVCIAYVYFTSDGRLNISRPSTPKFITLAAGTSTQYIDVRAINLGVSTRYQEYWALPKNYALVYLTDKDGSIYYEAGYAVMPGNVNQVTVRVGAGTYTDNRILYTSGGIVDNIPPDLPASSLLTDNRVYCASSGNKLYFSKDIVKGEDVSFSESFVYDVHMEDNSDFIVTALDNVKLILSESGIYGFWGEGPTPVGTEYDYSSLRLLSSGYVWLPGTPSLSTHWGVFFISKRGVCFIDKSGGVEYIGSMVEKYDFSKCVSILFHKKTGDVLFVLSDGAVVVFDTFSKNWFTWESQLTTSACLYKDKLCRLLASGDVLLEDDCYSDGDVFYGLSLETSWMRPGGAQGYFQVKDIGFLCEKFSGVKLSIRVYRDYDEDNYQEFIIDESRGVVKNNVFSFKIQPTYGKMTSIKIKVQEMETELEQSGFSINNITMEVAVFGGIGEFAKEM